MPTDRKCVCVGVRKNSDLNYISKTINYRITDTSIKKNEAQEYNKMFFFKNRQNPSKKKSNLVLLKFRNNFFEEHLSAATSKATMKKMRQ